MNRRRGRPGGRVAAVRLTRQHQHENYWGRCWAVPLAQHLGSTILEARAGEDPPDVDFRIRERDGTETTAWGEVTAVYCNSNEAKRLWDGSGGSGGYWEPDAVLGSRARAQVERKCKKYRELAQRRGPGHLLVLLLSPLTSRSTRVEAEGRVRELLRSAPSMDSDPFETVWLGYRLPLTTPDEQEDPQHAFQDETVAERFNFIKCIWTRRTRATESPDATSLRGRATVSPP